MYAQITQNNKFTISLQYLKKEVSVEVGVLHAEKHENLLQIDTLIFKVPKITSLQCLCNISRKKFLEMKLIF